ncbi:MAG: SCO family protein [Verrucomicrobia bacterium]|nr:SCO family protein [Verrucomicrobiota bacterium]
MSAERPQKDVTIFIGAVTVLSVLIFAGIFLILRHSHSHPHASSLADEPEIKRELQPFVLTERSGAEVSRESVSNKFLVVNFIHTGCSISCEQVNKRMAEVQRLVANDQDVLLLSLTIDPRSDTPPALVKFADRFGADANRWLFLTGDKQPVFDLIESSFLRRDTNVVYQQFSGGFVGVDKIALVDKTGRVRRYFNGLQSGAPKSIVDSINEIRSQSSL